MATLGFPTSIGAGHLSITEDGFSATITAGHGYRATSGDLLGSTGGQAEDIMVGLLWVRASISTWL
jgi:hypothetical protein